MKKILLVLAAIATMTAVSCVKDELNPDALVPDKEEPAPNPNPNPNPNPPATEKVAKVVLNELCGNKVEYDAFASANKFIELYNSGEAEADLSGWQMFKNNEAEAIWTAPEGTKLAAGAYLVLEADQPDAALGFNAGFSAKKEVKIEIKDASGNSIDVFCRGVDATPMAEEALAENKEASFSRVPNGSGEWAYAAPTPGEANGEKTGDIEGLNASENPEPEKEAKVVFNELCGNKAYDGNKFIELFNAGEGEGSLEGWTIRKYAADATDVEGKYNICWTAPAGKKIAAGAYLVLGADQTDPELGFNAGLSAKKGVKFELVDAEGNVVDKFVRGADVDPFEEEPLSENKEASYSRVPNGTGEWAYAVPTPGEANGEKTGDIEGLNASENPEPEKEAKVVFNELCGNKAYDGNKFIELFNAGEAEGSLEGWTIRKYAADATDVEGKYNICWTAPAGKKIAAGAYIVLGADQTDPELGFNAGLSAKKGIKFELVDAEGNVVDKFVRGADVDPFPEDPLPENKEASYSRVPNGSGEWAYAAPTPGEANGEKTGDIEHE